MTDAAPRRIRVGAIGAGGHATLSVLPNLAAAGLSLHAVCTRHLESARASAARFGAHDAFDDPAKMMASTDLDAVVVVVPPDAYAPLVQLAIDAGLPVFAEKPAATSADEADSLAASARAAGVPVVVGYQKRFAQAYEQAQRIIEDPSFGPVTGASFIWSMGPMSGDLETWLFENPVHHLDLARFLLGELSDVKVIRGTAGNGHALLVTARTAGGAPVSLHLNTTGSWHQRNEVVEIFGQGQAVEVDNVDTCTWRTPERPERVWRPNYTVPLPHNSSAATMGFAGALAHFREVAAGAAESRSSMASAAATLRLAREVADLVVGG